MLFRRVLDNLLENAHKYSPDADQPIVVRGHEGGTSGRVRGRGPRAGDPGGRLTYVFTPFFRGERSRSRGTGGVGLGLTLAKRIVEAHKGSIAVTSEPGGGTTVRVSLPVQHEADCASQVFRVVTRFTGPTGGAMLQRMPTNPPEESSPRLSVVYVEDDERLGRLTAQYLASHDVEVSLVAAATRLWPRCCACGPTSCCST